MLTQVHHRLLASALVAARDASLTVRAFTDPQVPHSDWHCYLSADRATGFAVKPDGELVAVFSTVPGRGAALVEAIKGSCATHGYCIGGFLVGLYEGAGFDVTDTYRWDPKQAPPADLTREIFRLCGERPNVYKVQRSLAVDLEYFDAEPTECGHCGSVYDGKRGPCPVC